MVPKNNKAIAVESQLIKKDIKEERWLEQKFNGIDACEQTIKTVKLLNEYLCQSVYFLPHKGVNFEYSSKTLY